MQCGDGPRTGGKRSSWRPVLPYLRVAAGVGLLAVLLIMVPLAEVAARLRQARLLPLALAAAVSMVNVALSALKLRVLVGRQEGCVGFLRILRAYYVGVFFNNFLPTTVGGDVMKVNEMRADGVALSRAVAATVLERGSGVLVVLALGSGVALVWPSLLEQLGLLAFRWPLVVLFGGGIAALPLLYVAWRKGLGPCVERRGQGGMLGWVLRLGRSMESVAGRPVALAAALALSCAFYLLGAVNIVLATRAAGGAVGLGEAVGIVALVRVPEMLPLSVGGLGLREGALTYCLVGLGVAPAQAAAAALLLRALTWLHSGAGGCLYAVGRRA